MIHLDWLYPTVLKLRTFLPTCGLFQSKQTHQKTKHRVLAFFSSSCFHLLSPEPELLLLLILLSSYFMPDVVLSSWWIPANWVLYVNPFLGMRNLRPREDKWFSCGYTASRWHNQDLNSGTKVPAFNHSALLPLLSWSLFPEAWATVWGPILNSSGHPRPHGRYAPPS